MMEDMIYFGKKLFEKYTGINLDFIKVSYIDDIEVNFAKMTAGAKTSVNECGEIEVFLKRKESNILEYKDFLTIWHEFVHCLDIMQYGEYLSAKPSKELIQDEAFLVWTEFSANYNSWIIYLKFMEEAGEASNENIEEWLVSYIEFENNSLLEYYKNTNTYVFELLYSYATFYGKYLASIHYLKSDKYFQLTKEFAFDYRFISLQKYLYDNINFPKDEEKWKKLRTIIDSFKN